MLNSSEEGLGHKSNLGKLSDLVRLHLQLKTKGRLVLQLSAKALGSTATTTQVLNYKRQLVTVGADVYFGKIPLLNDPQGSAGGQVQDRVHRDLRKYGGPWVSKIRMIAPQKKEHQLL